MVVSFDLFDTCITRRVAKPADLFVELGLLATHDASDRKNQILIARKFAYARILGESRAHREPHPRETVTLDDIYKHTDFRMLPGLDAVALRDAELALESDVIFPVPAMISRIESLRRSGANLIFTSDMYLSSEFLRLLLMTFGLMKSGDGLYVSCDAKHTKRTGGLFRYLLAERGLVATDLLHVGDNLRGDIQMPKAMGIRTEHFTQVALNDIEQRIVGPGRISLTPGRSLIAAFSRESRMRCLADGMPELAYDSAIHAIIAPLMVCFVLWVLEQAHKDGIKRLYFVARDGQVMYKIAQRVKSDDDTVELRYLYGSRRAWRPASVTTALMPNRAAWLDGLTPLGLPHTPSLILDRIGLNRKEKDAVYDVLHLDVPAQNFDFNSEQYTNFIKCIADDPGVRPIVEGSSARLREPVLEYFCQEGLYEPGGWALVDVGWGLHCQSALKRILSSRLNCDVAILGYYFALGESLPDESEVGLARSFAKERSPLFYRRRTMIEHAFTPATHPSTVGYRRVMDRMVPVFDSNDRNMAELIYAEHLQKICEVQAAIAKQIPWYRTRLPLLREELMDVADQFISRPTRNDANALSLLTTAADFFHNARFRDVLCRPLDLSDLIRIFAVTLLKSARFRIPQFAWLEGSASMSPPYIRVSVFFMLRCKRCIAWVMRARFKLIWRVTGPTPQRFN